jgi:hypothetical protein
MSYLNKIAPRATASVGTLGFQRLFVADSVSLGEGQLLGALEGQHYNGPWDNPDDQRKVNAAVRYSNGDERDGYSITGAFCYEMQRGEPQWSSLGERQLPFWAVWKLVW